VTVKMLYESEEDLESAYDYYQAIRPGLGVEMMDEFRRAVERILSYPNAWHLLDESRRRCQLHRFPYGIIYELNQIEDHILIIAVEQLNRKPEQWRRRIQ
jgi:hypothetical protein